MKLAAVVLTLVVAATSSSACVISLGGFSCDMTASRAATLDFGDATRVRVRARAGSLRIEGHPDLEEVRASGTACAGSDANLERVTLTTTRVGTELVIETDMAGGKGRLDLVVEIPASLPLVVDDSSGDIEIYDVAALELRDGSGDIEIDGVAGDVRVVDGSGDIEIDGVAGDVRVVDGSGDIDISAVRESVVIEDDGSGDIDITDVGQDVIVEEDGNFVVKRGGSGSVRHSSVRGQVRRTVRLTAAAGAAWRAQCGQSGARGER